MLASYFLKRVGLIAIAGCLAIAVAQGAVASVVVFSNLSTGSEFTVGQVDGSLPRTLAAQFTSSGNFTLVDAQVFVLQNLAGGVSFNVWIAADAGGLPGTFLEQIGFNIQAPPVSNPSVVTANSIATPLALTSGTKYWLVLTPANASTSILWDGGGPSKVPVTSNSSATFKSGWAAAVQDFPQFQIDGISASAPPATPVPPSVILSLIGLASVGLYQLHRRMRIS